MLEAHHILYDWLGLNVALFHFANDIPGAYQWPLLRGMIYLGLTQAFVAYFPLIAIAAWLDCRRRADPRARAARLAVWTEVLETMLVAYVADTLILHVLKGAFHYPRPFLALPPGSVHILPAVQAGAYAQASFPSGHSAIAMLLAAGLWPALDRRGRIAAVIFVLAMMFSRIALGVHFPADVAGGAGIALIVTLATRAALVQIRLAWQRRAA